MDQIDPWQVVAGQVFTSYHFCPQPTNSDSCELFSMELFVYIDD